jgi:hypothetical protein
MADYGEGFMVSWELMIFLIFFWQGKLQGRFQDIFQYRFQGKIDKHYQVILSN